MTEEQENEKKVEIVATLNRYVDSNGNIKQWKILKIADELVKNINYDPLLPNAICCNAFCSEPVHKEGSVYCEFHAKM